MTDDRERRTRDPRVQGVIMNISIPFFSLARNFASISTYIFLARYFAHLARPQVRDEHRRIVIRRASSTGREHSQGAKLPLKTGGVLADTSRIRERQVTKQLTKITAKNKTFYAKQTQS